MLQYKWSRISVCSLSLGLLATPMLQACDETEFAIGAAVVAVGATIAAGSAYGNCGYRERVCRHHYNYWGERVNRCRYVVRRRFCPLVADAAQQVNPYSVESLSAWPSYENLDVADFASTHELSLESAERFIQALDVANEGELSGLRSLGLSDSALNELAALRVPSLEETDALSRNLDQQPELTQGMLAAIVVHGHRMRKAECDRLDETGGSDRFYDHYCQNN